MKLAFRNQSASIILLPDGEWGEELLHLAENWSKNWLIQPAYWLRLSDITHSEGRPPEVLATVVGRNGRRTVDLFEQLSRYSISLLRLISIRLVEESAERSEKQDSLVDVLAKYIDNSKPLMQRVGQHREIGSQLIKVNLIFSPSEVTGASYPHLHETLWNFNIVVAPEDRTFPTGFDSFISSANKKKFIGFILSNTATAAGIWTGQTTSAYEEELKHSQNSVQYDKVLVQRSFTRAIVSDALAFRVAAHALEKLINYSEEGAAELQRSQQNLKFLPEDQVERATTELLNNVMQLNNKTLDYEPAESLKDPEKKLISLKNRIYIFFLLVLGIFSKLPIWIFTAIWKGISNLISKKIDSNEGEFKIDSEIDFPKTKLDGITEAEIIKLEKDMVDAQLAVDEWPRATLRKVPPGLFSELRGLIFNHLDNTYYKKTADEIFADPSHLVPDFNAKWNFEQIDNYQEVKKLFTDENESFDLFEVPLEWTDPKKTTSVISDLNAMLKDCADDYSRETTELETLKSELEILGKGLDTSRIRLKTLQRNSKNEVLDEKK